ncbi:hypothetical protein Trco_002543 [Trichoderma cornu-damae]|uniref:Uncharacterized protein n=1 Tax=Trichoderma cornu-damae TaxID=654480 RepID=A0A9P8QV36_9HYPO|nr:hypothetical protein Trco_002543 [Trichoderma cornu-damae]
MSFSRNRQLSRPVVEPIETGNANLPYASCGFTRRQLSPMAGAIPARISSLDSVASSLDRTRHEAPSSKKQALAKLRIPETTSEVAGLTTPLGTLWTISRQPHPTPVSAISPRTRLLPFVTEARSTRGQAAPAEAGDAVLPGSPETLRLSLSVSISASRRPPNSSYGSAARRKRLEQIQRLRLELWEQGAGKFGRFEEADVFVKPLPLRRARREIRSWSEDPGTSSSSPASPAPSAAPRRLFVRAIIRSKTHTPIGLKREFDLDALRATIPDPLPSPRSPNFSREALLSNLEQSGGEQSAPSSAASTLTDASDDEGDDGNERVGDDGDAAKAEKAITSPPIKWRRFSSETIAVPMHIQYARAQLPALAAIMMSDTVRRGDTIELALPHPRAWPETVAYVYTGEEELLTKHARENILYLGGKIH